jgi:hypothetical protein
VLVVWSPVSVASRWVRGEAREAAERGILVPVRFEQARLPMDVRAIHTTDLDGFAAMKRFNGLAIAVGSRIPGEMRLAGPRDVRAWLEGLLVA